MVMLEAAMAFAVAMIIFSTIVTSIVEFIHRLAQSRSMQLRQIVGYFFDEIVWPRLKDPLCAASKEKNEEKKKIDQRDKFIKQLTFNPMASAVEDVSKYKNYQIFKKYKKGEKLYGNQIDKLTPLAFAERLGRTEVGKAIVEVGEQQIDLLITDFARTFDRLGRTAKEFLDSRARSLSIVVGIILALAVNIDAGRLITTLIENPDLRSGLIEQANEVAKENQEAVEKLEMVIKQAEDKGQKTQPEANVEVKENGEINIESNTEENPKPTVTLNNPQVIQEMKVAAAALQKKVEKLQAGELPIGYKFFPYCPKNVMTDTGRKMDSVCEEVGHFDWETKSWTIDNTDGWLAFIRWIVLCVVAGVLMGLGGPFWYRAFSNISQVMQMVRALGIGKKVEENSQKTSTSELKPEDSAKPQSVLDAFKVAAAVHNPSSHLTAELLGKESKESEKTFGEIGKDFTKAIFKKLSQ